MSTRTSADHRPWWEGATIYQVYLRSFMDGDGDGIGDLPGLTYRLDHLASLGVDALWLSPLHPSGGADGGYDVVDYRDVAPEYGGLEAFQELLEEARRRDLRVILDFVPNHTSERHPWFQEALSQPRSPRRDWYIIAPGRDGQPPSNWYSRFGGRAWKQIGGGLWYLHSFYPEQPDLNWHQGEVREELGRALRFWLDLGVDGFRLDALQRLSKDPLLRDNPRLPGMEAVESWEAFENLYNANGPHTEFFMQEIRRAVGPGALLLGEVWVLSMGEVARYLGPGKLDMSFNFRFQESAWQAGQMGAAIAASEARFPAGSLPSYNLSNHDVPRHPDRYGRRVIRPAAVLLLGLRGAAVLYMGEEIGMVGGEVPRERQADRLGRDSERTPMQWDGSENAGFCPPGVEPWLPVAAGYQTCNVASQQDDPHSTLSLYRQLIHLRRASPALRHGTYRQLPSPPDCLVYLREAPGERLLVAVNFASEPAELRLEAGQVVAATQPERRGERVGGGLRLEPDGAAILRLD